MVGRLKLLGMNQSEFAERLGVNASTVLHWKAPMPQYAVALIEALEAVKRLEDLRMARRDGR